MSSESGPGYDPSKSPFFDGRTQSSNGAAESLAKIQLIAKRDFDFIIPTAMSVDEIFRTAARLAARTRGRQLKDFWLRRNGTETGRTGQCRTAIWQVDGGPRWHTDPVVQFIVIAMPANEKILALPGSPGTVVSVSLTRFGFIDSRYDLDPKIVQQSLVRDFFRTLHVELKAARHDSKDLK